MSFFRARRSYFAALVLTAALLLLRSGHSADDKKLTVYVPHSSFSYRVEDVNGQEYVSLLELLAPIASVNVKSDKGVVRVKVNSTDLQFQNDNDKVKVGRGQMDLGGKAVIDQGRVLVPIGSLTNLLAQSLKVRVDFHLAGRRLFLDNTLNRANAELKSDAATLVLTFTQPVAPAITTDGGRMRITFTKEPVAAAADSYAYNDKLFQSLKFQESNGAAELVVNASSPLLASFGDSGKTILITAAPSAPVAQAPATQSPQPATGQPTAPEAAGPSSGASPKPGEPQPPSGLVRYFVMIDPAHGGEETGAKFSESLAEKDVTLAIARRLKTELQNRGVPAVLLRDQDSAMDVEQRALAANSQRAALYVSIHAGSPGGSVRVFTALMPSAPPAKGVFVPWESAQSTSLERSHLLAVETVTQLTSHKITAYNGTAPVPPLNSIAAPAIAIEVGPQKLDAPADSLMQQNYQQSVAVAAATAIANARSKVESMR